MATNAGSIYVEVDAQTAGFKRGMRSVERDLNSVGKTSKSSMRGFSTAIKGGALAVGGLAIAGGLLGRKLVSMAGDAAEVESKFKVVFGREMPRMVDQLDKFSEATGASRFQLRQQVADMGALLVPLSENRKAAGDLSVQFVKLATDLSSFNNVPVEDALLAIRSGLVGEAEPLRRFGVLLNETAVKQEALRMGLIKGKEELTEQQKVQARANLIMKQTALAQGDAERTSGSFANQVRRLQNSLSDMGTEIGQVLLPHMLNLVTWVNEHMPEIKATIEGVVNGTVFAIEDILVPAVTKIIDIFKLVADEAEKQWPRVQAAAESVANWYRDNLEPTIASVSRNLPKLWDKSGEDMQNSTKSRFKEIPAAVKIQMDNTLSVVNASLALLRGDWSTAWDEIKVIPGRTIKSILDTLRKLGGDMANLGRLAGEALLRGLAAGISRLSQWLQGIEDKIKGFFAGAGRWLYNAGLAVLQGLWDGLKEKWNAVVGWLSGLGGIMQKVKGPESKDKMLLFQIGKSIIQGLQDGMEFNWETLKNRLSGLSSEVGARMGDAVDNAIRAVESRRGRFEEAVSSLTSFATAAFDRLSGQHETPAEKKIRVEEEKRAKQDRLERKRTAQENLNEAIAGGDPEAIKAAQQELADATWEIEKARLERLAETQRQAYEDRRELQRRNLEKELAAATSAFERGRINFRKYQERLKNILEEYGIPFRAGAKALGVSIATGLTEALTDVRTSARSLLQAIREELERMEFVVNVEIREAGRKKEPTKKKARGGSFAAGDRMLVGEEGPELVTFGRSGNVTPNHRLPVGGGVGAQMIEIRNVIMLDEKVVYDSVIRQNARYARRNGEGALAA